MKFFRQCRTEERQTTRLHNRTRSTMTEQGRGSSANFSPISIPSRIRDISLVRRHAGGLTRVTERGKRKREREKGITRKRISSEELSSREKSETTRARARRGVYERGLRRNGRAFRHMCFVSVERRSGDRREPDGPSALLHKGPQWFASVACMTVTMHLTKKRAFIDADADRFIRGESPMTGEYPRPRISLKR